MTDTTPATWFYWQIFGSAFDQWCWYHDADYDLKSCSWPVEICIDKNPHSDDPRDLKRYDVTKSLLVDTLKSIRDDETMSPWFRDQASSMLSDPETADLDASSADCIIQLAIFGEIRYG